MPDRTSPRRVLDGGALATIPIGVVFDAGLRTGSLLVIGATLAAAMFVLAFNNGPLGSWLARLFPVRTRYTGVSLAFNLCGIVGGAIVPLLAQWFVVEGASQLTTMLLVLAGLTALGGAVAGKAKTEFYLDRKDAV